MQRRNRMSHRTPVTVLYIRVMNRQISLESKNRMLAPGLRGLDFFRLVPSFKRDTLGTFSSLTERFGDTVCLRGLWTAYIFTNPADVEYVLQTNSRNYPKSKNYDILKSSTGNGLFVSEGEHWLRQRRLAQPIFHQQRIGAFCDTMSDSTAEMLARWEQLATDGEPFDLMPELMRLTLSIVGKSLLSTDLSSAASVFGDAFETVREFTVKRLMALVKIPDAVPTPLNLRFRRAIKSVDKIVYRLIGERRKAPDEFDDLLTMLMRAQDAETGATMNDVQLRDEVMTLIGAGYETTTQTLGWTFYLLGENPEKEAELRAEIENVLAGRTPTFEDLPRLEYTRCVFQEAMRMYPPVWAFSRVAVEADQIGGFYVPAKSEVLLLPFITHRHAEFWDAPEQFEPERFSAENSASRPKFAYFPFGGGARQCVGNHFAQMEAQIIIAMILQKFRLSLVENHTVEPETSVTLRPKNGIKVILEKICEARDS